MADQDLDLKAHIRCIQDFPKPGIGFYDISTLLAHPRAWRACVRRLADDIKHEPSVEHVAYFGSALHVSGRNRAAIQAAIDKHPADDVSWGEVRTSLEDAFIALSAEAGEDKRVHA